MNSLAIKTVNSPNGPELNALCDQLKILSSDLGDQWPAKQMEMVAAAGVYRWFVPEINGGAGWTNSELATGYVELAAACLTTTFIITQRAAAIRRICGSENERLRDRLMPDLLSGKSSATVGISHLTTSRQHVGQPVLRATETENGFLIDGFSPWVTGAAAAAHLVMGAQLEDGKQILFCVPTDSGGISTEPGFQLVGLTGSQTGAVRCEQVSIDHSQVLAGPVEKVLSAQFGSSTGGVQTSALAIGLAQAALNYIRDESVKRPALRETYEVLLAQYSDVEKRLLQLASGVTDLTNEQLRTQANSLVLRATQAALVAAKGAGYLKGNPVGRWCQEALFFLVWSCPQAVLDANLCELVGVEP